MTGTTISVRIDKNMYGRMKEIEYINWSAVIRKALEKSIEEQRAKKSWRIKKAIDEITKIRKKRTFDSGRTGTEIIRKWRNKRKF